MTLASPLWRERILLIAPFFFWGTAMVAMKGVLPETSPLFMAGIRILPAGFLILAVAMITGRSQPTSVKAWLWIALFGLVDGTLFQGFLALGLERTSAGLGSVMIDSQPLAVAVLAWLLYSERVGALGWLGLLLGVMGISLIGLTSAGVSSIAFDAIAHLDLSEFSDLIMQGLNQGEILMLMAALSMAVGTVMIRKVCEHADAVTATGWHLIIGGLPLVVASWMGESEQVSHLTLPHWGAIAYASVFGSAIAYGLFFYFASKGNLTSLSSLTFLTPVFALIFGNLFLGEVLNSVQFFGVIVTLISIFLVNQRELLESVLKNPDLSFSEKVLELIGVSGQNQSPKAVSIKVEANSNLEKTR